MTQKTMSLAAFTRLKKYMQMTLSGSESEKAFALQKANEAVLEAGVDWNHILDRCVKVELEIESADDVEHRSAPSGNTDASAREIERAAMAKKINEAFATIEASDPKGTWADFIADLKKQWDERGRLTGPQLAALFKGAQNVENRR